KRHLVCTAGNLATNANSLITIRGKAIETNGRQTTLILNNVVLGPATLGDYFDSTGATHSAANQPFTTNVVPVARLITALVQTLPTSTTVANNTSGVKYQITVNNQGPDDLTSLTLRGTFSS